MPKIMRYVALNLLLIGVFSFGLIRSPKILAQSSETPKPGSVFSTTNQTSLTTQTGLNNVSTESDSDFPRILTQPDWLDVIIGAAGLIIGTLITLYIFRQQKTIKSLSYEVMVSLQ